MPETISEKRLRELEYNCREEAYGDAKFGGTMLGCAELRALIAAYREWEKLPKERDVAMGEINKWARMCRQAEGKLSMLKSRIDALFVELGETRDER